ncbi:glycoside hydrolase [Sphaerosporella brunnea]|uniref:Glycoside hydrolase n=1 Tax=Sphaerosporella brunnea TaxID=1250544 RepID=A0A5J5ETX8_9PEZI|nr:glycoside hydrolase [Sphaerosporella brunnea]
MRFQFSLPAAAAALLAVAPRLNQVLAADRKVFAHYMVGLTSGQTADQWASDIAAAKAAGIDGFALNSGPSDSYTLTQLTLAYNAAAAAGNFVMFISFDMACCGAWPVDQVSSFINSYKDHSAQYKVDGKPFVSTFEGPSFADSWASVKAATGPIYLVPDWSSLGPSGVAQHLNIIDGAFSWDAWGTGFTPKTDDSDIAYQQALGSGKSYMMPVSPWFYTNVPQWSKNWLWNTDTLWYDRWEQVMDIMPDFVEIISWNDYSESHYIGDIRDSGVVDQAKWYVDGVPHTAWQFVLPYYTAAYKAGTRDIAIPTEGAVFWYRANYKDACSDGGTVVGPGGTASAATAVEDAVFVFTLSNSATTVTVGIGGGSQTFSVPKGAGFAKLPFNGRNGQVVVSINGKTGTGPVNVGSPCTDGKVNFNAVVGKTS